ncbi:MAG: hypothetical protein SVW02_00585 [Candidatus Nanohaloarchaea archaeon]|nr:hypothetical protein [Candidatus Nanohaloarchaea archaeon]
MGAATRIGLLAAGLFLLSAAAAGQPFTVDVDVQNPDVAPGTGEAARFNISVTNTGDMTRTYSITYNVANPGWYFLPEYALTIPPGATDHAILYAEPGEEAGEGNIGVIITVSSGGAEVTRRPSYRIVRDRDILITKITTDDTVYDPGTPVNVTLDIKNVRQEELAANAYRAVFALDGKNTTVGIPSLIASEPETVTAGIMLDRYAHGTKTVTARVERADGAVQDTATATLQVRATERIVRDVDRRSSLFTAEKTLSVANQGNTVSQPQRLSITLPVYVAYFTAFSPEPDATRDAPGFAREYTWDVGRLDPGASVSVQYQVNRWVPALLLLLLAGAAVIGIRAYRRPHIVKRVYRKDGHHSVHLRVENRSGRPIDDVVVKDFLPSICSLVEKFDASPPERIRGGGETTELEWELGRLAAGEERILTYSLSSQVQVEGETTLPSAHMEYVSRDRRKKQHSHPAQADFQ